jgi:hypothetical protein
MNRFAILLASSGFLVAVTLPSHGFAAGSAAAGGLTLVAEKATVERPRHPRIVRKRPNNYQTEYEKGDKGAIGKDTGGSDKSGGTSGRGGAGNDKGGGGGGKDSGGTSK